MDHEETEDTVAALAMAEALARAVRNDDGAEAVAEIRHFAENDEEVLREAHRRCLSFDGLDGDTRRAAASLLWEARVQSADRDAGSAAR